MDLNNNISSYEQVNNVNSTASTSASASGAEKSTLAITPELESILKKIGLTPEQWQALSPEKQQEYINNYNKENNIPDVASEEAPKASDLGVKGCYVESTNNIENPPSNETINEERSTNTVPTAEETPANVNEKQNLKQITKEEWKAMSAEERAEFFEDYLFENLKDIPEDKKGEVLKELLDNKLKEKYSKFDSFTDDRKERLRQRMMNDFSIMIEKGFTPEDFKSLSTVQRLQLEIDNNQELINEIEAKRLSGEITTEEEQILDNLKIEIKSQTNKKDMGEVELTDEEFANSAVRRFIDKNGKLTKDNFELYQESLHKKYENIQDYKVRLKERCLDTLALIKYARDMKNPELEEKLLNDLDNMGFDKDTIQKIRNGEVDDELLARLQSTTDQMGKLGIEHHHERAIAQTSEFQGAITSRTGKTSETFEQSYTENPEYQELILENFNKTTGSQKVFDIANHLVTLASEENQNPLFDMQMDYTNTFATPQEQMDAQKQLSDIIPELYVDNQLNAYKTIQTSKYEDVQTYAASNIYKLDESVRQDAVTYTKSLGNTNVTNAIQSNQPAETTASSNNNVEVSTKTQTANVSSQETVSYINSNYVGELVQKAVDSNSNNSNTQNIQEVFKELNNYQPKEQLQIIDSLPDVAKKDAIILIVRFNPSMLSAYIFAGRGVELLNMNLPLDVRNKVINMIQQNGDLKSRQALTKWVKANHLEKIYPSVVKNYDSDSQNKSLPPKYNAIG